MKVSSLKLSCLLFAGLMIAFLPKLWASSGKLQYGKFVSETHTIISDSEYPLCREIHMSVEVQFPNEVGRTITGVIATSRNEFVLVAPAELGSATVPDVRIIEFVIETCSDERVMVRFLEGDFLNPTVHYVGVF